MLHSFNYKIIGNRVSAIGILLFKLYFYRRLHCFHYIFKSSFLGVEFCKFAPQWILVKIFVQDFGSNSLQIGTDESALNGLSFIVF